MLLAAAIIAGTTHQLSLPFVILAAACGAILERRHDTALSRPFDVLELLAAYDFDILSRGAAGKRFDRRMWNV